MFRSIISSRVLMSVAGLSLLAACAEMTPAPAEKTAVNGPELAGGWYQVFFDNDVSQINPRGKIIIQAVANVVKTDPTVRVNVVGKTDRLGSTASNLLLSQQRAARVRESLIALGVPPDRIATSWSGESKQDVTTSNNVAEQGNRVVDITVQRPFE